MAANVKSQLAQLANLSHSKDVIDKLVSVTIRPHEIFFQL